MEYLAQFKWTTKKLQRLIKYIEKKDHDEDVDEDILENFKILHANMQAYKADTTINNLSSSDEEDFDTRLNGI